MKVKIKEKKLLWGLCPTFTPSIKPIQADHAMDIILEPEYAQAHPIPETKLGQKTQQNYNKLNHKMYYKSVIIHKNRIFPYFQNKVKKPNNLIIIIK